MMTTELTLRAEVIARKAHHGQKRNFGKHEPYIVHPMRVAERVASLPGMDDLDVAAAILHDTLEDCGHQWEAIILEKCGQDVLDLVKELTYPTDTPEWKHISRDEKNVIRYEHARKMSNRAKRIKLVDRWDNLLDLKLAPKNFIEKYKKESVKLLEIIGDVDAQMKKEVEDAIEALS